MTTVVIPALSRSSEIGTCTINIFREELISSGGRYDGYRVVRVEHYKEKTASGHEFLVLYLRNDDGKHEEVIFRVEGSPSTQKTGSTPEPLVDDSISQLAPEWEGSQYDHISTMLCILQPPLTVLDICDICSFIRNPAPLDGLMKAKHCYWFCMAFLLRVQALGYALEPLRKGREWRNRGYFRGLRIITEKAVEKELSVRALSNSHPQPQHSMSFCDPFSNPQAPDRQPWQPDCNFSGHIGCINSICFTPDGRHLLSASVDHTIRIWDVNTGQEARQPLKGHTDCVRSIDISSDGKHVVSVSDDETVQVWDLEAGVPVIDPIRGHTGWVWSVAFSPDSGKIASGSQDKSVRIWDVRTGSAFGKSLLGHVHPVRSVAWSPDGHHIASGSDDTTIRIWNVQTGAPVHPPLRGHTSSVVSVAFSLDGRHIISGSPDQIVRIWDVAARRALGAPLPGPILSVALSPDGRWLAAGSQDETVRMWETQLGGAERKIFRLDVGSRVRTVAWSPGSDRIAAGCWDGNIRVWYRITS